MIGLCIALGGATIASLPVDAFTLAWTHSIEKIRWEEDYRVEADGLRAVEARIRGTGAGMEPPEGAVLREGVWHYRPAAPEAGRLVLARSGAAADYELCVERICRPLSTYLNDPAASPVELGACHDARR